MMLQYAVVKNREQEIVSTEIAVMNQQGILCIGLFSQLSSEILKLTLDPPPQRRTTEAHPKSMKRPAHELRVLYDPSTTQCV